MKLQYFLVSALAATIPLQAGDFLNLGFDSANTNNLTTIEFTIPPVRYQVGTLGDLIPGWSITYDGVPYRGLVDFNHSGSDVPSIQYTPVTSNLRAYFVYFCPSARGEPSGGIRHDLSLWQIGRVPDDAWELLTYGGDLLYMNGVPLASRNLEGFNRYAWDVRQFAGTEAKCEVRSYDETGARGFGLVRIDIFGFAIPEPSEWALLVLGGGMLFWASRFSKIK